MYLQFFDKSVLKINSEITFFRSPLFRNIHQSMSALKICHSRNLSRWSQWVHVYNLCSSFKNQFSKTFFFCKPVYLKDRVFKEFEKIVI